MGDHGCGEDCGCNNEEKHDAEQKDQDLEQNNEDVSFEQIIQIFDNHIVTLIELLVDKGVFTREEFNDKMDQLIEKKS